MTKPRGCAPPASTTLVMMTTNLEVAAAMATEDRIVDVMVLIVVDTEIAMATEDRIVAATTTKIARETITEEEIIVILERETADEDRDIKELIDHLTS